MKTTILKIPAIALFIFTSSIYSQPVFWDEIPTGVSAQLSSISNVNGISAWACGQSGTVLRTSNRGYNWVNVSGNGIPATMILINIFGLNDSIAITAGYTGANTFVYRTSNRGANWSQIFTQANGFINAVWMTSITNGFMQGDPVGSRWSLWRTSNGGLNWDSTGLYLQQAGSEAGWNNSMWVAGSKIWFGTNNTRIYYSTNNGANWQVQASGTEANSYVIGLDTLSPHQGFSGGATMLRTTNGGAPWSPIAAPGTGNIFGVVASSQFLNGSWMARGNTIYISFNNGMNWFTQFTSSAGTYTHLTKSRAYTGGPGVMYATKSNGGITRGNLIIEGVLIISGEVPQTFTLFQNYPNPFNPTTKIVFSVPQPKVFGPGEVRGAFMSLKVYNALGKEVETLHEKIIQPGTYQAEWNGNNYPSGIYFYVALVSDPNSQSNVIYRDSRKMVLIK